MTSTEIRSECPLVSAFRKRRSWSWDELATAAGLNLRTIQRIKSEGTTSIQSMKALAAALEANLDGLTYILRSV